MILLMFVGFPLLTASLGFAAGVLLFIILAVVTSMITAVLCHRLTARLDLHAPTFARWMHTLHLAFYPIAVPRCLDGLYLRHFPSFDGVSLAYVVGGRQLAERFGRYYLAQIARMEGAADSESLARELARIRNRRSAILASVLKQIGSSLEDIREAPRPAGPDCQSYCPSCFVQYKLANGTCHDCGGIALQPLNAIPTNRDSA
jgi:hypothetical protein